MKSKQTPYP